MLFSHTIFLCAFLTGTITLYYLFKNHIAIKNTILFLVSIFFYAWGESRFVFVMLASILLNYLFGLAISRSQKKGGKGKIWLIFSIIVNLGLIFVFKYLMFTVRSLNLFFSADFAVPEIALPIGISFFTFQALSYVVDVYRKTTEAQKNPLYLGLYIAFFPQLIAGPIVRYETIAEQIRHRKETWKDFSGGCCRFLTGLAKKVLLSNTMALIADKAFELSEAGSLSTAMAWLGIVAYTLQIYHDFSGYSDMAIGLGRMFGFHFLENFDYPYISASVTEFWRRWHISLGTWFRDYVYFPMGGSRVNSRRRLLFNLLVVWFLTGVWHGASFNFMLWGLFYFVLLAVEKLFFPGFVKSDAKHTPLQNCLGRIYTILAVMFGWVLFRAETLGAAGQYFRTMFTLTDPAVDGRFLMYVTQKAPYLIAAVLFALPLAPYVNRKLDAMRVGHRAGRITAAVCDTLYPLALCSLLLVCISYLLKGTYNPFIYFNF